MSAENEEEIKYLKIPFPPHLPLTAEAVDFQLCLTRRLFGRGMGAGPAGRDTSGSPERHPGGPSSRSGGSVRWGSSAIVRMLPHAGSKAGLSGSAKRSPKISPSSPHGAHHLLKGCTPTAAASGICWWSEAWESSLKSTVSATKPSFP